MICRLCLSNLAEGSGISLFDSNADNAQSDSIQMITKYIQLEIKPDDSTSTSICNPCWMHLHHFNQFYNYVEQKQLTLRNGFFEIKCISDPGDALSEEAIEINDESLTNIRDVFSECDSNLCHAGTDIKVAPFDTKVTLPLPEFRTLISNEDNLPGFEELTVQQTTSIKCSSIFTPHVKHSVCKNAASTTLPNKSNPESSRKKNCSNRQQRQILRNQGLPYTSSKHTVVSARVMGKPCNDNCRLKCKDKFSEEIRKDIFDSYWAMGSLIRQRDFIARFMTTIKPKYQYKKIGSQRQANHSFYFLLNEQRTRVCKSFFRNTLGINDRPIRTVLEKQTSSGVIEPDNRGRHYNNRKKTSEDLLAGVRNHITNIPRIGSHSGRKKTTKEFIDGSKNLTDWYKDYQDKCIENKLSFVKIHTYRKIFKSEFNIGFFVSKKEKKDQNYKNVEKGNSHRSHIEEKGKSRDLKFNDISLTNQNLVVSCYDLPVNYQWPLLL